MALNAAEFTDSFPGKSFGVFDGHAGTECSEYLAKHLQKAVCGSLKWKATDAQAKLHSSRRYSNDDDDEEKFVVLPSDSVSSTLKKVFQDVDARFLEKAKKVSLCHVRRRRRPNCCCYYCCDVACV